MPASGKNWDTVTENCDKNPDADQRDGEINSYLEGGLFAVTVAISQNFRWATELSVACVLRDGAIPWEPRFCWGPQ